MNENKAAPKEEFEVDLQRIFRAILNKLWIVGVATLAATVITLLVTFFIITPKYESSAMFYVNNNNISVGDITASVTSSDISASKSLVASYIVILNTRASLEDVIEYSGVERTYEEISKMISASAVNSTEIFEVVVTSPDPKEAEAIASAIAYILPKRISGIIEGTSAKVVEPAVVAVKPSSPSYLKNTVIGVLAGLIISIGAIAIKEMFDLTVRNEEDITQTVKYPILAAVPDMTAPTKGGYYAYNKKKAKSSEKLDLFGENISFAASEAYKLLRTKIQFSFADDDNSHIICTTSAFTSEGKSLTAVNIACSLSQLGKKVLLVDCDLRRPSVAAKIGVELTPGLSDYLTKNVEKEDIVRELKIGESTQFNYITAGRIPPNPMELLSSVRMEKVALEFKEKYDYVIFDLPPVEEVGDALVAAKLADGILMVVRQDYCHRNALENSVKQLEFVNAKILGVIFNATKDEGVAGKYYTGKYYNKKYYGSNENSYESSANEAKQAAEK